MALATPDTILHQQQHYYQTTKREDLEGAQKVSDAALAYFDKLKPSRVDSCVEYWQVELFSSSGWAAAYPVVQWLWQIAYHEKKIFIFTSQVSVTSEKSCLEIDIFSISTPKAIQLAHSSCRMISVRRIIQFGFGSTPQSRSSHRLGRRGRQRDRPWSAGCNCIKVLLSNSSLTYTPVSPSRYILELLEKSCLEYWQVELFSSWECHLALVLEGSPRDQLQRCAGCLVSHWRRQHIRGFWRRGLLRGRTEGDCQGDGPVPGSAVCDQLTLEQLSRLLLKVRHIDCVHWFGKCFVPVDNQ